MFKILSIASIISYLFFGCRAETNVIDSQSSSGDSSKDNDVETITILENNGTEIVEKKVPITELEPVVRDKVEQKNQVNNNIYSDFNSSDAMKKRLYDGFSDNLKVTDFKNNPNFYTPRLGYNRVKDADISSSEMMYVDENGTQGDDNICTTKYHSIYQMSEPCSTIKENRDKIIKNALGKDYSISNNGRDLDVYRYEYTFKNNGFRVSGTLYGVKGDKANTINVIGGLYAASIYGRDSYISIDFGKIYIMNNGHGYQDPVVLDSNNKPLSGVVYVYIDNQLDGIYDLSTLNPSVPSFNSSSGDTSTTMTTTIPPMDEAKKQKLRDLNLFNID